jgi:hypothetical protein
MSMLDEVLTHLERIDRRLSTLESRGPLAGVMATQPASTDSVVDVLRVERTTQGTAANGIGAGQVFFVEDASGNVDEAGNIDVVLTTAAHATQAAEMRLGLLGTTVLTLRSTGGGGITLASGNILVGNASGTAAAVTLSGDASLSSTGVLGVNKTRLNVRNETGVSIAATKAVYTTGFNNLPLVLLADCTDEAKHNVLGVTIAAIADDTDGVICVTGQFDADTDTPGWAVGTELYLGTAGALTSTKPTSGIVQHVGIVTVKASGTSGKILRYDPNEPYIVAAPASESIIIRTGTTGGASKISFRDYGNTERAAITDIGGLTAATLSASGNAFCGTTSGGLHVGGTSDPGDNNLLVDGTITLSDGYAVGWGGTANGIWGSNAAGTMTIVTNNTARLTIDASGVVSINGKALSFGANDSFSAGYRTVKIANA